MPQPSVSLNTARRRGWRVLGVCISFGYIKKLYINELILRSRVEPETRLVDLASRMKCTECGTKGSVNLSYVDERAASSSSSPKPTLSPWGRPRSHEAAPAGSKPAKGRIRHQRRRKRVLGLSRYALVKLVIPIALLAAIAGYQLIRGWTGPVFTGPARVIDGDTIDVGGRRIRIWGIAAPEMNEAKGPDSKRMMARIVGNSVVNCRQVDSDRYGRAVSRCEVDGSDLGALMVESGSARDCTAFSYGRYLFNETAESRSLPKPGYCAAF